MNGVVAENALPGAPARRGISRIARATGGEPGTQHRGFATEISVDRGATVSFKVSTAATAYHLDIYRLGFYQGLGARHVATVQPSAALPQAQPGPVNVADTGCSTAGTGRSPRLGTCPPTQSRASISPSSSAMTARRREPHSLLVRRDDGSADVLFQTSDSTWQAYNTWGGRSLYSYSGPAGDPLNDVGRAYAVSYNRPLVTRRTEWGLNYLFAAEYPMIRFLEANGFDVEYCAGVDVDRSGARCYAIGRSSPSGTTSTGPRASARTSSRRATAESTSPSAPGTRCIGGRDGSPEWRRRAPHAGLLQGDARESAHRPERRVDRDLAR